MVLALSITSQYSLKSVNIRQKYFRIMDCSEAGLKNRLGLILSIFYDLVRLLLVIFELLENLLKGIRFVKFYVDRRKG